MIPINLGIITFFVVILPILLLLTLYSIRGVLYFYKYYTNKQIKKRSLFTQIRYLISISLVLIVAIEWLIIYSQGYYSYKTIQLKVDTKIDGILFPAGSIGKFTKNEKGLRFHRVKFNKPFDFNGIYISSIAKTYDGFYQITTALPVKINGVYCDNKNRIFVDKKSNLMRCWLDDKNIFSAVSMPKGLKIEHYKADATYSYYHERREKMQ